MSVNGSSGRLEAILPETGHGANTDVQTIKIFDNKGNITTYNLRAETSGHGGGDERLRKDLFLAGRPDPLGHRAGSQAGVNSIIIGIAANISIKEKRIVTVDSLIF